MTDTMQPERQKSPFGTLYIVSTPIGNTDDISFRALKVLKSSELIVCEEIKEGIKVLKNYNISKDVDSLNEQNEVVIECTTSIEAKTGVEMEALVGASIAALTVYDMCKAFSHDIMIKETKLMKKSGGKRDFERKQWLVLNFVQTYIQRVH